MHKVSNILIALCFADTARDGMQPVFAKRLMDS